MLTLGLGRARQVTQRFVRKETCGLMFVQSSNRDRSTRRGCAGPGPANEPGDWRTAHGSSSSMVISSRKRGAIRRPRDQRFSLGWCVRTLGIVNPTGQE